jgi:hypothetical protein
MYVSLSLLALVEDSVKKEKEKEKCLLLIIQTQTS